jgi:polo-like kinase 4
MIERKKVQESGMVQRVRNEVEIQSRLKHPSILEMYNYFEDETYIYFILEMCHNGEVYRYLKTSGRKLMENEVCHIFKQVVQGVLYLHSHNIVHRDLSLANVLLTDTLDAKISDFGLATQLHVPEEKHYTMCGTPNFIAPEVASRGPHGLESDVWSLGCMLYALFTGRPPFDKEGEGVRTTLNRVVKGEYSMPKHISSEAQDLIFRLLQKDPKHRIKLEEIMAHPFLRSSSHSSSLTLSHVAKNGLMSVVSQDSGNGTLGSSQFGSQLQRGPLKATVTPKMLTSTPAGTTSAHLPMKSSSAGRTSPLTQSSPNVGLRKHRRHGSASATVGSCISEEVSSASLVSSHTAPETAIKRSNSYGVIPSSGHFLSGTSSQGHHSGHAGMKDLNTNTKSKHLDQSKRHKPKPLSYSCPTMSSRTFGTSDTSYGGRETSMSTCVENQDKMSSLVETTPPLNAIRLAPIKQEYTSSSLSITESNEVCLEIFASKSRLKKGRNTARAHSVKEIVLISCNGMDISVYKPTGKVSGKTQEKPNTHTSLMDTQKFPGFVLASQYSYHNLASRYWELYKHAAQMVLIIRSMTPKVVLYTEFAKCKLMENGPNADFDASFYTGQRVHLNKDSTKVALVGGVSAEYPVSNDVSTLPPDVQQLVERAKEGLSQCTRLEEALTSVEQDLKIGSCFPVRVRSRPPSSIRVATATQGQNTSLSVMSPSMYGGPSQHERVSRQVPTGVVSSSPTSQAVKQCNVPGIGKAEQLANGSVVVYYAHGDRLCLQKGDAAVKYATKDGPWTSYDKQSVLPPDVKSKLQQVPTVIQYLNQTTSSIQ